MADLLGTSAPETFKHAIQNEAFAAGVVYAPGIAPGITGAPAGACTGVGVGAQLSASPSASIKAAMAGWRRSLSRQRRRLGPMLPTGMPSLALIWA